MALIRFPFEWEPMALFPLLYSQFDLRQRRFPTSGDSQPHRPFSEQHAS